MFIPSIELAYLPAPNPHFLPFLQFLNGFIQFHLNGPFTMYFEFEAGGSQL
jgi:hypothetical protein